mgnify:CR=1 FL=1
MIRKLLKAGKYTIQQGIPFFVFPKDWFGTY